MNVKKGDFIEIDFIAKLKDEDKVFDLTDAEIAKKENIFNPNYTYKPLIICLGENHVIKGLDSTLIGKEVSKEYIIEIQPEQGYGRKNAKLIQLVSTNVFRKQKINPVPGLQVQIDNMVGIIKTVSGGRTLVDFNHPLAGKVIEYKVKILRIIKSDNEKIRAIFDLLFQKDIKFEFKESNLTIKEDIPEKLQKIIEKEVKKLVKSVKKFTFSKPKT